MKYLSLIIVSILFVYFISDNYKQIKRDRKIILKNLKMPFLRVIVSVLVFDMIYNR